jgi:hypothetical protein
MKMLLVGLASAAGVLAVFIALGGHGSLEVRIALAGLYLILSAVCATGAAVVRALEQHGRRESATVPTDSVSPFGPRRVGVALPRPPDRIQ